MIPTKVPVINSAPQTVQLDKDRSTIVIRPRILQANQWSWNMCWSLLQIFNIL